MDRKFWRDTGGFLIALFAMFAIAIAMNCCYAHGATIEDQFDATCRLATPGTPMAGGRTMYQLGTGCVIDIRGQYAIVLTNEHVIRGQSVMSCEFWCRGHQSAKLPGQVYCYDPALDAALVLVPANAFGNRIPKPMPIARTSPAVGSLIRSVGCAQGTWPTAWEGHVLRIHCVRR